MEQYISEAVMLILGAFLGWLPNRKKQKVDTKQIEVDVLEKSLQVLDKNVVQPLLKNMELLQEENASISQQLKVLKNAINKMYKCRTLDACPIRIELQKSEGGDRKGNSNRPPAYRPRDSTNREGSESGDDSSDDSDSNAQ